MISKQTQKFMTYFFAVLLVVLGSIILVAMAQGYRYDFLTGQIRETGLVLIDSNPNGADIYINGKRTKYKSPLRLTDAPVGKLTVEQVLTGYRVWRKILTVQGQEVSFADYAILLPQKLTYTSFLSEYKVTQLIQTSDKRKTFMLISKPVAALWQLDNNNTPNKRYEVPGNSADPSLVNLQISADGNSVLFRQNSNGLSSLIAIAGNNSPVNITEALQIKDGTLSFNPDNNREIFWLSPEGVVRKVSLENQTLGPVLANNVVSFSAQKSRSYFVTKPDEINPTPVLWVMDNSGQDKKLVTKTLPPSTSYQIDYSKPRINNYVAVLASDTKQLFIVSNPTSDKPTTSILGKDTTSFSFSNDGAYIVYNSSNTLKTYDFERALRYSFGSSLVDLMSWYWYDDSHILVVANKQLRLIDYDGQNDQVISDTADMVESAAIRNSSDSVVYTSSGGLRSVSLTENKF